MSYIVEEIEKTPFGDLEMQVLEKTKGEYYEPYKIVTVNIFNSTFTPDELIEMGKWFQEQGKRIKKTYTSTGKRRSPPSKAV